MKFVLFVTLIWSILDSGWSITDEEYFQFKAGLAQIQILTRKVEFLENENQKLQMMNHELRQFKSEQQTINKQQEELNSALKELCGNEFGFGKEEDFVQNTTIEERVAILELQMAEVQEDMEAVQEEVDEVEDQIAFLFDEQVIQDERIFNVEERTLALDERVEVLEAGGGGGGNVTALEERVETLEGTAAQHETDIADLGNVTSNLDARVLTLEGETGELETRLTVTELQIEGLQATDIELDSRITDLEEGGGGGSTIAFRAVMNESDDNNSPESSTLIFSDVQLNEGDGYDPVTGVFTVPSGGEGYYYLATHFTVDWDEFARIDIRVNNVTVCTMFDDNDYYSNGACNALQFLAEGDEVRNIYWYGTDSSPVWEWNDGIYNAFTGFRI